MRQLLVVCHDVPSMSVGATLPLYHMIINLSDRYDITLVCFDSHRHDISKLTDYLKDYSTLDIPEYTSIKNQLAYTLRNMLTLDNIHTRSILNYYYRKDMKELIDTKSRDCDVIVSDMPMAFYVKDSSKKKVAYVFDAVADYNHRMYDKSEALKDKLYWYLNYKKTKHYEKCYDEFDRCVVVNKNDKNILRRSVKAPISVIANGVDTDYFKSRESSGNGVKLVFLGDMSTPPNNDAVRYFVDEIYPLLLSRTSIPFYVVGRKPTSYIRGLESEVITVTGEVSDVREYLDRDTIFVTPMISGTGIKNKILEAMSMQLAVVSTSKAMDGIYCEDGWECLLADSPDAFSDAVLKLSEDEGLRTSLGEHARLFVEENHSWSNCADKLDDILMQLLGD